MTCYCLIILCLILPLPSVIAAHLASSSVHDHEEVSLMKMTRKVDTSTEDMQHQMQTTSFESTETGVTNLRPWKPQSLGHHQHLLARNAHGALNIIGWGTLLPVGVIIARYFRDFPLKFDEWYPLHILCQTSGYLLGAVGWAIGLWLGNSSKQYTLKTHRILGILVFTLSTVQMLAVFVQPRINDDCRKCWVIYHHLLGYALIALSIANIFQGAIHQTHADRWKWVYVGVLSMLALVALSLEALRWIIKYRIQHPVAIDNNMHNFS